MSFLSNGFGWLLGNNESSATGTVTSISTAGLISGGIITVSGTITTSVSTNKLVGRGTSGTGVMEEITLGTNLSLTGTTLNASGGGGGVTSVTGTTPIASSGGATPNISISQATTSTNGYLSSTDWTTFNNKGSGTVTSVGGTLPISSSGGITPNISISQATTSTNGYLSSTDWNTFNNKGSGTVTSVGGTLPIASSGGATPTISITQSSGATNGYLSSTDWTTFNNKGSGTVTSVSASVPTFLSIAGSPITTSGTLAISLSGTALPVLNGGTGVTTSTGSGDTVLSTSPTLVTPILGSASATALTFTSTAVSGSTINKLTTAQRQALTPVIGDVVYDTTIGTTCTYNGTFWEYTKEYYATTNVSTTTTLASNITGLTTFTLEANSSYNINGQFLIGCTASGGVKFGNTLPAGAVSLYYINGISTSGVLFLQAASSNGTLTASGINRVNGTSTMIFGGVINIGATAGTVSMQFASATGGQTSTVYGLFASGYQSKITLTKIA